jgi:hypothetical protein
MDMAAWLLGSITVYNFETKYHWGYYWPGLVKHLDHGRYMVIRFVSSDLYLIFMVY